MKIKIIGWSGVIHSYSIIMETYMKYFFEMPNMQLFFKPADYYRKEWVKTRETIFDKLQDTNEEVDVAIRFVYPYDLSAEPNAKHTLVFMTCEYDILASYEDTQYVRNNVWILTPSDYSKQGLIRSGIDEHQIVVIPHGYEYIPSKMNKQQLRDKYKIPQDAFVFYNNSSLTGNKNVPALLRQFYNLCNHKKNVMLYIKGNDKIYNSSDHFYELLQRYDSPHISKIVYNGNILTDEEMSELYDCMDCYVSPFLAEGFNLPVLESLCHGVPVICTRGGPPDEFAKDAYFINSVSSHTNEEIFMWNKYTYQNILIPNEIHLFQLMVISTMYPKEINKKYYIDAYSPRTLANKFYKELSVISKNVSYNPTIILLKNINLDHMIDNIRYYNKNVKISIINERDVSSLLSKLNREYNDDLLFINNNLNIYCDPVHIFETYPESCLIHSKNTLLYAVYHKYSKVIPNIHINIPSQVDLWIPTHDYHRVPHIKIDNEYIKIREILDMNFDAFSPKLLFRVDDLCIKENFLKIVDCAILRIVDYPKYQHIARMAKSTILFKDDVAFDLTDIDNKKILFVYNESLEFFFDKVFPHLKNNHIFISFDMLDKYEKYMNDKKINKWYSFSANFTHEKLIVFPVILTKDSAKQCMELILNINKQSILTTCKDSLEKIVQSKFVDCRECTGEKIIWFAMYTNTVPIVDEDIYKKYASYPIIKYSEFDEKNAKDIYENVIKNRNLELLKNQYYSNLIKKMIS